MLFVFIERGALSFHQGHHLFGRFGPPGSSAETIRESLEVAVQGLYRQHPRRRPAAWLMNFPPPNVANSIVG